MLGEGVKESGPDIAIAFLLIVDKTLTGRG